MSESPEQSARNHAVALLDDIRERGASRSLPTDIRMKMERSFAADFSRVRIHESAHALALRGVAFTIGNDVFFAPGEYQPRSLSGQELLGHELAHVLQQRQHRARATTSAMGVPVCDDPTLEREADLMGLLAARGRPCRRETDGSILASPRAVVQYRERVDTTKRSELGKGDWLKKDREDVTLRWKNANLYNLLNERNEEYTTPPQRAAFYLWFYNHVSKKGFEVRWPLAAFIVASGAAEMSESSLLDNDIQETALLGNQIIFDDVLPKLKELHEGSPLRGIAAHQWDAQTLSEEQNLVQAMYEDVSDKVLSTFETYAKKQGAAWWGLELGVANDKFLGGDWHYAGKTPAFQGDIREVDDRYRYGMLLASRYSTHAPLTSPAPNAGAPPKVGESYRDGSIYDTLNKFQNLHKLDSQLDDMHVDDDDEEKIIKVMQKLSEFEQQELGGNEARLLLLVEHLDHAQRRQALRGLESVSKEIHAVLSAE